MLRRLARAISIAISIYRKVPGMELIGAARVAWEITKKRRQWEDLPPE